MKFEECNDEIRNTYLMHENASYWIYPHLMKEKLRIWIYSGDVDADVPTPGTIHWIQKFKEEQGIPILEPWREWWVKGLHTHEDQVGGMTWELRGLTFASVRGAGHMVPKDKRKAAYVMFESFLDGKSLP